MHGRAVYCYNSATQIIYKFLELSCNDHLYHNKLFVFFIVYVLNLEANLRYVYTLRLIGPISYPGGCDSIVHPRKYSVIFSR